jgi:excisionase family DNA binding protein
MSIHSLGREGGVQRELFSPKEAETILGVSHATLYRLINSGQLDSRKIGSKAVITRASLQNFIAGLPVAKTAAQVAEVVE